MLVSVVSVLLSETKAQNLVPNPSFEDTVSCPNSGGQVWKAQNWQTVAYSPDYFHICNQFWQYSIPFNSFGYQWPATGNAYMGLWGYSASTPLYREIIGAALISPLIINQKYFLKFNVNVAYNPLYGTNAAINKLGALLSTTNYLNNSNAITNWCQIYTDSIIADSINWTPIRGSFIADSAYSFISLSNFFGNNNTDTIHLNISNTHQAYYYVDDICLSSDSMYCELWTGLPIESSKQNFVLFPNPVTNRLNISNIPYGYSRIEIIDVQGRNVLTLDNLGLQYKISINISSLPGGVYSIILINKSSIIKKIFIKL